MLLSRKIVSGDSLLQLSLLLLIINTVIVTGRRHNREVEYGGNYGGGSETFINELDGDSVNILSDLRNLTCYVPNLLQFNLLAKFGRCKYSSKFDKINNF
jgi:hypothetical protein